MDLAYDVDHREEREDTSQQEPDVAHSFMVLLRPDGAISSSKWCRCSRLEDMVGSHFRGEKGVSSLAVGLGLLFQGSRGKRHANFVYLCPICSGAHEKGSHLKSESSFHVMLSGNH